MASKPVKDVVKLQIPGGQANPAPPVGTALGPHGIALQDFCSQFNEATKDQQGDVIPVEITIYEDRTFDFTLKVSPVADLIKKELGLDKGSSVPNTDKVGTLTEEQVQNIAEKKMQDLNAFDQAAAQKIVKGTARSMGVVIE
ncbi:MAG: 50S ribosomal protein L11 [Parcubacteria group bacterium SW_4_46_8]|nr:MAG: 50S ribosomal protein L11 [Parcubacteria group bacterium SW_4_46_8]